ncbi:ParB/RepB/Spo0J family partition protein [Novosphingobium tardum]|uniref:ParB/RepB/Spo0J family partition protein n=1 Tax=Novosphingobium tardum TaxID=1538021 RepID=A0ABV8RM99_9SPHN
MTRDDDIIRLSVTPSASAAEPHAKRRPAALGRGLGALMGETRREEPLVALVQPGVPHQSGEQSKAPKRDGLAMLAIADIVPHPDQPRRHFEESALDDLAHSIAARGVIQPIIVRPTPDGRYQLVAGERRWRAAQRARLHEIPALVRELADREVTALALIENLQREDLNPVEEAQAYHRLSEEDGLSQQDIAKMVDKSRSHVANMMRLLALPAEVLALVQDGQLSMGHARALVNVPDPGAAASEVVARGLSVRATERLARKAQRDPEDKARRPRTTRDPSDTADIVAVQRHLEEFLGLKVAIHADADPRSGAVTIRYRTLDQLDLICQRLTGGGI